MTIKYMKLNYQVIIKTRSICMFWYIASAIYFCIQIKRGSYWKLMGNNEPCLEWVPCMPGTTVQKYLVLSQNVPLGTETYYMPVGLNICPNRNRVSPLPKGIYHGDYGTPDRQAGEKGCQYTPRKRLVASRSNPKN